MTPVFPYESVQGIGQNVWHNRWATVQSENGIIDNTEIDRKNRNSILLYAVLA